MIEKLIETQALPIRKAQRLLLKNYPGCMDIAFRNTGNTTVTITPLGGTTGDILQPGDPLLTWGGYQGYYRSDTILFSFGAGSTPELKVFITIHSNFKECK